MSPSSTKNVVILGATGSIGVNALRVIEEMEDRFRVVGLSAYSNVDLLSKQIKRFKPEMASVFEESAAKELKERLATQVGNGRVGVLTRGACRVLPSGVEGMCEMVSRKDVDVVLLSVVGGVGFAPLLAALKAGKTVALANKEPMVMAGRQFMIEAERWGGKILPVDSEPSAIFQCLSSHPVPKGGMTAYGTIINRVFLTASGGAFYRRKGSLSSVTVEEALAHPTWKMGKKITIDCATLMNKGFETIEIMNLFGLELRQVEVVIHPQSIIHSAAEFKDGSVLAQLSPPDMKLPIQLAMTWPERTKRVIEPLDLFSIKQLTFDKPDFHRFPCLELAREAARAGSSMPAVLNAADEVAVESFTQKRAKFTDIPEIIEKTMKAHRIGRELPSFAEIVEVDEWARAKAREIVETL